MDSFNLMIWNAHSIRNKISEFNNFIINNNIDIAFISESWLQDQDKFFISNYNVYRADRIRGGALLLIRSDIPHNSVIRTQLDYAEAVTVNVVFNSSCIYLTALYISPAASRTQFETFYSKLLNFPGQHLIAGDFNCTHQAWNNRNNSHKGIDLLRLCNFHKFSILRPNSPTHIAYHGGISTIDFALNRSSLSVSNLVTLNELSSDHLPVCFSIISNVSKSQSAFSFNFAKANWKRLCADIKYKTSLCNLELHSTEGIDESINSLNVIITDAIERFVPRRKKDSHFRHKFSAKVQNLIHHRNHFRNLYQRTLDSSYKSSVNQLNRMIKRAIGLEKKNDYDLKLESLTFQDNSLFKHTKSVKNRKRCVPPLQIGNDFAYSDKDKAEALAGMFCEVHTLSASIPSRLESIVTNSIESLNLEYVSETDNFSEEEVISVLSILKPRKAAGFDLIPNCVLKALCNVKPFVTKLTSVLNACLSLAYFPSCWKHAKIVAIPKSNPASSNPSDYRPISLLSTTGKVFERLILIRLNSFETYNHIIIDQQFGFKSRHSTTQQVLRITEKAALGFNVGKSLGLVFLDLRKAYDSVWHDALIHKLIKYKYPLYLIKLIQSYLSNRTAFVSINDSFSELFRILAGVPQGSVIAPHLFNIFINDIPIPNEGEIALFADDTAYFIEANSSEFDFIKSSLLAALTSFQSYFNDWKIKLNDSKTEFIILTKSTKLIRKCLTDVINFDGNSLKWKSHVRYLGVHLDNKLLYKHHIDTVLSKSKSLTYSSLYSLLKRKSNVSIDSKIRIYKSIIRPIFTYACPIYVNCAKSHLKKLQVFQNKILRQIFDVRWDDFKSNESLHQQAHIPTVNEFILKLSRQFYSRSHNLDNNLVSNLGLYNYDALEFRVKHRLPKPTSF